MNVRNFIKKYGFSLAVAITFVTLFLIIGDYNWERAFVLIAFILLWLFFSIYLKNNFISSLLFIFLTLPFNITFQIQSGVLFFNTDPYVSGVYTNYLVPTLSVVDIGLVLLLISFIFDYGIKNFLSLIKNYFFYFISLLLILFIQNISSPDLHSIILGGRLILGLIDIVLVIDYFKTKKIYIDKYVMCIGLVSVLIQGVIGIFQFKNGSSLGLSPLGESQVVSGMQGSSFITLSNEVFLRAYGTFPHPNVLAGYLLLNIFLSSYFLSRSTKKWKVMNWLWLILSELFIWFTFSRIGIVLSLLCFIVTIVSQVSKGKVYSFTPALFLERFINLFIGGDTSWRDRLNLMKVSFRIVKERWLLGTGLGNFTRAMDGNIPLTVDKVMLIQPVHNVPLLMFSELGIFGFISYLITIFVIWVNNHSKMNLFKWCLALSLLVIGCFDHYLWSLPQGNVISGLFLLLLIIE